jgi:MtfA peptidase
MFTRILGPAHPAVEIPDPVWESVWSRLPFVQRYDRQAQLRLRSLCTQLLESKIMSGAAGLQLSAWLQVNVLLQASLPILELGIDWYRGWKGIIVYPSEFQVFREEHGEDGVVHESEQTLAGESWEGGPVVISWEPVEPTSHPFNVVIHEFAHKLDQLGKPADGRPPFDRRLHPDLKPGEWDAIRDDAFERLNAAIDLIEAEIPADVDPESEQADPYFARLPMDPYAAQDPPEFFAVSTEAFFVDPARLLDAFPQWYDMLSRFFRQTTVR